MTDSNEGSTTNRQLKLSQLGLDRLWVDCGHNE
jgi:hypothetical protein